MKKGGMLAVIILAGAVLFIFAGGIRWLPWFGGMTSHHKGMMSRLPDSYAGQTNPLRATTAVLEKGLEHYKSYCLGCHGVNGRGDGPAGAGLIPPPADLAFVMRMPMARDDYLYWKISEGGSSVGSAMPAFKTVLSETDRWALLNYLRSGLK
ncbi:MAG: c-type cytochrome [Sedimenticola sp.]|nr:c-type cytochrome [Sedimenticola sp.]